MIGSLWFPADYRPELKARLNQLRQEHDVWGEFKWNKVSPARLPFYRAVVSYFFSTEELRFRAIVIDAARLNLERFHQSDAELGFYKFYYQLLTHWIVTPNSYAVFCDDKVNRDRRRLTELGKVLTNANRGAKVLPIQSVASSQSTAVQMCDVLLGATQWCANGGPGTSQAKRTIVADIENQLGHPIGPTPQSAQKFNVFNIRLRGDGA